MVGPNDTEETQGKTPEERLEAIEEAVEAVLGMFEELSKKVNEIDKKTVKKSTGLFGGKRKSEFGTKDTVTGNVYPTKAAAGKALASEYDLDPLVSTVYYTIMSKAPDRLVDATAEETEKARKLRDEQKAKEVAEANKRLEDERKVKEAEEAKKKAEEAKPEKK